MTHTNSAQTSSKPLRQELFLAYRYSVVFKYRVAILAFYTVLDHCRTPVGVMERQDVMS